MTERGLSSLPTTHRAASRDRKSGTKRGGPEVEEVSQKRQQVRSHAAGQIGGLRPSVSKVLRDGTEGRVDNRRTPLDTSPAVLPFCVRQSGEKGSRGIHVKCSPSRQSLYARSSSSPRSSNSCNIVLAGKTDHSPKGFARTATSPRGNHSCEPVHAKTNYSPNLYAVNCISLRSNISSNFVSAKSDHSPNLYARNCNSLRHNNSSDSVPAKANNSSNRYSRGINTPDPVPVEIDNQSPNCSGNSKVKPSTHQNKASRSDRERRSTLTRNNLGRKQTGLDVPTKPIHSPIIRHQNDVTGNSAAAKVSVQSATSGATRASAAPLYSKKTTWSLTSAAKQASAAPLYPKKTTSSLTSAAKNKPEEKNMHHVHKDNHLKSKILKDSNRSPSVRQGLGRRTKTDLGVQGLVPAWNPGGEASKGSACKGKLNFSSFYWLVGS